MNRSISESVRRQGGSAPLVSRLHCTDIHMDTDEGVPLERGKKAHGWRRLAARRLPILSWGAAYDRTAAVADLVAGVTLGLTLVPQSIAYASLANLPVQYGLYSAYVGTMLYVVLGTVKEVSIGPTSLMALLTLQLCRDLPIEFMLLLTFLSGCVVLIMGLLRLGFLVDLISPSVTSGFTSATAIIIVVSQVKSLLGLSFTAESVLDNVSLIYEQWHSVRIPDVLLGIVCCTALLLLRAAGGCKWQVVGQNGGLRGRPMFSSGRLPADDDETKNPGARFKAIIQGIPAPSRERAPNILATTWASVVGKVSLGLLILPSSAFCKKLKDLPVSPKRSKLKKTLWLVSIGRNALVVLCASAVAMMLHDPDKPPLFNLAGRVAPGVPRVSLPPFSATIGNTTVGFAGMAERLGSGLVMTPIVMVLANIAIAKAFSSGGRVDATQEMLTLGLCNIAGSFVHAMPTCGAFTRSAVSHSSGVRSPAAGLYSGLITLMALIFLTKYFYFIPKACLSSVLICAVIFMMDFDIIIRLWRRDRVELCVLVLTFVTSIVRTVELAVLAGVLGSLAALVRRVLRPPVEQRALRTRAGPAALLRPALAACYLNAELIARRVREALVTHDIVLLDCSRLGLLDYAASQVLERLAKKVKEEEQTLIVFRCAEDVIPSLEGVAGLERRALRATSPTSALLAVRHEGDEETSALLLREEKDEQV